MRSAPLATVIREAAEPHVGRGKEIHFEVAPAEGGDTRQPSIFRRPEVIHGLRNLVQNAVDFSAHNVWITANWTVTSVSVRIIDDGQGFPPQLIGRIGDPFVHRRNSVQDRAQRPEYEGMGLGLFIAKTLLERAGAELSFANGSDPFLTQDERPERCGAIVEVIFPRHLIVADEGLERTALGQNRSIEI
jgi:two-component system sensor histidine kinase RegB